MTTNSRIVATYPYFDATDALAYEVVRLEPKSFRQRRPDGRGGWVWSIAGLSPLPYRLPQVLATARNGGIIFKVEGEKDADNLAVALRIAEIRANTTCNNGGAGHWGDAQSKHLTGATVVIIPDNDSAGAEDTPITARALRKANVASLKVVELPDNLNGQPVKDVSDWLAAGGKVADLLSMVERAPEYYPPAEPSTIRFPRTVAPRQFAPDDHAHQWAQKELDRKAGEVARLADGRHTAINAAAFYLGTIAAHHLLTESECQSALESAAASNGSLAKYKIGWFNSEFGSGFKDGLSEPYDLPDYVKYADDSKYSYTTNHPCLYIPSDTTCHTDLTSVDLTEVDDLPSLADELATIGIKRDPQYLITWGKAYQAAVRDIFGSRARSINRLLTAAVDHLDYGAGEPFTPADMFRATGLDYHVTERAVDAMKVFTVTLLYIDDLIYIPQNVSKSKRGRKSQYRLTVLPKNQIDAALIRLYRQHLYMRLCKSAGVDPLAVYQDILQGLPEYPIDDLPELFTDVQRELWAALDPAVAGKQRAIMREVESKLVTFRKKLHSDGQITAERDTQAVVAAAIKKFTDPATRLNSSGAVALADVAEQAGVSIDTVTRHSHDLGWRRVPVIRWSDHDLAKSTDLPKPYTSSKRYRGAFVAVRIVNPDGSDYGTASAGKGNLRAFVHSMISEGRQVYVGYRTASVWKQAADLTDDDQAMIEKYNRRSEPPTPAELAPTSNETTLDDTIQQAEPRTPALPRLFREKMRARDNTAQLSDALKRLLLPSASPTPESEGNTMYTVPDRDDMIEVVTSPLLTSAPMLPREIAREWAKHEGVNAPKHLPPTVDLIERMKLIARGQYFAPTVESGAAR